MSDSDFPFSMAGQSWGAFINSSLDARVGSNEGIRGRFASDLAGRLDGDGINDWQVQRPQDYLAYLIGSSSVEGMTREDLANLTIRDQVWDAATNSWVQQAPVPLDFSGADDALHSQEAGTLFVDSAIWAFANNGVEGSGVDDALVQEYIALLTNTGPDGQPMMDAALYQSLGGADGYGLIDGLLRHETFRPIDGMSIDDFFGTGQFSAHPMVQMMSNMGEENRAALFGNAQVVDLWEQLVTAGALSPELTEMRDNLNFVMAANYSSEIVEFVEHAAERPDEFAALLGTDFTGIDPNNFDLMNVSSLVEPVESAYPSTAEYAAAFDEYQQTTLEYQAVRLQRVATESTPEQLGILLGALTPEQREQALTNPIFTDGLRENASEGNQYETAVAADYDLRQGEWMAVATPEQIYTVIAQGDLSSLGLPDYITNASGADLVDNLAARLEAAPTLAVDIMGGLTAQQRQELLVALGDDFAGIEALRAQHVELTTTAMTVELMNKMNSGDPGSIAEVVAFLEDPSASGIPLYGIDPQAYVTGFVETLALGESQVFEQDGISTTIDGMNLRGFMEMLGADQRNGLVRDGLFAEALIATEQSEQASTFSREFAASEDAVRITSLLISGDNRNGIIDNTISSALVIPETATAFVANLSDAELQAMVASLTSDQMNDILAIPEVAAALGQRLMINRDGELQVDETRQDELLVESGLTVNEVYAYIADPANKDRLAQIERDLFLMDPTSPEFDAMMAQIQADPMLMAAVAYGLSETQYLELLDRLPDADRAALMGTEDSPSLFAQISNAREGTQTMSEYLEEQAGLVAIEEMANFLRTGDPALPLPAVVLDADGDGDRDRADVLAYLAGQSPEYAASVLDNLTVDQFTTMAAAMDGAVLEQYFGETGSLRDSVSPEMIAAAEQVILDDLIGRLHARVAQHESDPYSLDQLLTDIGVTDVNGDGILDVADMTSDQRAMLAAVLNGLEPEELIAWVGIGDVGRLSAALPDGHPMQTALGEYTSLEAALERIRDGQGTDMDRLALESFSETDPIGLAEFLNGEANPSIFLNAMDGDHHLAYMRNPDAIAALNDTALTEIMGQYRQDFEAARQMGDYTWGVIEVYGTVADELATRGVDTTAEQAHAGALFSEHYGFVVNRMSQNLLHNLDNGLFTLGERDLISREDFQILADNPLFRAQAELDGLITVNDVNGDGIVTVDEIQPAQVEPEVMLARLVLADGVITEQEFKDISWTPERIDAFVAELEERAGGDVAKAEEILQTFHEWHPGFQSLSGVGSALFLGDRVPDELMGVLADQLAASGVKDVSVDTSANTISNLPTNNARDQGLGRG